MINWLKDDKRAIFWLVFHVLLGVVSAVTTAPLFIWYFALLVFTFFGLLFKRNRDGIIDFFVVYTIGIELISRILLKVGFLPYETGKYVCLIFFLLGILFESNKRRFAAGTFILLLSLPSVSFSELLQFKQYLVFNYFGILDLALGVIYFSARSISWSDLRKLLRVGALPIISSAVLISIKAPKFSEIDFKLGANFAGSGGFGPNQVSTVLGVGLVFVILTMAMNSKMFKFRMLDLAIIGWLLIRCLITFSRGGVVGAVVAVLMLFLFPNREATAAAGSAKSRYSTLIIFAGLALAIFFYVDDLTGNQLSLRFQGETSGTVAGAREKDLNLMTSGRVDIFVYDVKIWMDNFWTGVGPGVADDIRKGDMMWESNNVIAHNEISRLLAEHGFFGFLISLILIIFPFVFVRKQKFYFQKAFSSAMFFIALFSSMHSAMRTSVTPVLFALATIQIIPPTKEELEAAPVVKKR